MALGKSNNMRNFCIIAHIDHGKSTLADRILQLTGAVDQRQFRDQMLDDMELEREHGITIKARTVRLHYKSADGKLYILNLIDTPGHVDFSYEVSRSLAACEGALLLVDAARGVQAQTMANVHLAQEHGLPIIPIINKIDLTEADTERVVSQIRAIKGLEKKEIFFTSARFGTGVKEVLEAIVHSIPPPSGDKDAPLRTLIFDSLYDSYRGVVVYIRVVDGTVYPGQRIRFMGNGKSFTVTTVGIYNPKALLVEKLTAGEVGYLTANIRNVRDSQVGDTITNDSCPADYPLPGYKPSKSMVFCGLYPIESEEFSNFEAALERLSLNDSSFIFSRENSPTLGYGFRCGFLGMLHMEIVQERLEREYNLDLIATAPSVSYRIWQRNGKATEIENPSKFPKQVEIEKIEEPYIRALIICPDEYLGAVMQLLQGRRSIFSNMEYLDELMVSLQYEMPLSEMVIDFYDRLKSVTRGYASFDYEHLGYRESNLVKLDILLNHQLVEGLSCIVDRERAYQRGRALVEMIKEVIPSQLFAIAIQAAIGKKVIARETKKALRKDVTAKLYGGDVTRKRKLLEKQKKGKKRMKKVGKVMIPQEAFMALVKR